MFRQTFLAGLAVALTLPSLAHAATAPTISVTDDTKTLVTFSPFSDVAPGAIGGIAAADLGGDGVDELLVGAGVGMTPMVRVMRQDGSVIGTFLAYDNAFTGGVNVAACDVDGDGRSEIITGAKYGGGPHVRVFDAMGNPRSGFFAYDTTFRGGVNVACGDVTGDTIGDIVTGAGPSGGPHIKIFSGDGTLVAQAFNGAATDNTGVYVAVDDDAVLSVPMGGADAAVRTFAMVNDALTATTTVSATTRAMLFTQTTFMNGHRATANVASDMHDANAAQSIVVDISEQRLTAYAYGIPVNTFLISSGTYTYPTPYGKTPITAKIPMKDYGGIGYWLPNTPWNLRFRTHYYIHTAYWHNNFGHRMSHGCINVKEENAKWIYDWANVGTMVEIIP